MKKILKKPLLKIKNLTVEFKRQSGNFIAIENINIQIMKGESIGLLGESGSGKTILAKSILKLLPRNAKILSGEVIFEEKDLFKLNSSSLREYRGKQIAIIFQNPKTALNPNIKVGMQIKELAAYHHNLNSRQATDRTIGIMNAVGLYNSEEVFHKYPFQCSGGMLQKIVIARALIMEPKLLIADEFGSSLDPISKSKIYQILRKMRNEKGLSFLITSHDLGVLYNNTETLYVIYGGNIIERASCLELFEKPRHPYTIGLLNSAPIFNKRKLELPVIKGQPYSPEDRIKGCKFNTRCNYSTEICKNIPELKDIGKGHLVACFNLEAVQRNDRELAGKKNLQS